MALKIIISIAIIAFFLFVTFSLAKDIKALVKKKKAQKFINKEVNNNGTDNTD